LACLRYGSEHDAKAALAHERDTFLTLRSSFEARALRHVFLAESAAPKPRALRDATPWALQHCGVIGGGTMGAGIAAACLLSGLQVTLIERNPEAAQAGLNNVQTILNGALKRGKLTPETYEQRMAALTCGDDYTALQPCDLVIEAVFEDLAVKQEVFRKLTEVCGPNTILATNTSYLDPSLIVAGLPHPERFIGLHFFSPAHVMKLLEIVPTGQTSQDVLSTGFALGKRLGKIPVQAGICEGFIGNRILKRYRAEAPALVCQGVPIADVDAAMRAFGFRMGPFEAQDLGGLDIAYLQREATRNSGTRVDRTLGDILVEAGRKGQKTQGGWYDYVAGDRTPKPSEAVTELLSAQITSGPSLTAEAIAERLVGAMAAEGQAILDEGIAQAASDIDLVEVHGYGFPRWKGGPMFYGANAEVS
jgi:3-hydroxyacyl-CoA dehydrogenase